MRQRQVVLADVLVVALDVPGKLGPAPAEVARRGRPGGEGHIHEVRRAAHHAAGRARPAQHHRAPPLELRLRARDDEGEPQALAAGRRHVRHLVAQLGVVLLIVERGDSSHPVRETGVRGDVLDALAPQPDFALLCLQALDVLGTRSCCHRRDSLIHPSARLGRRGPAPRRPAARTPLRNYLSLRSSQGAAYGYPWISPAPGASTREPTPQMNPCWKIGATSTWSVIIFWI